MDGKIKRRNKEREEPRAKRAEMLTADFKPGVSAFLRLGKALQHARLTPVFALEVSKTTVSQHSHTCRMQEGSTVHNTVFMSSI